MGNGQSDFGSRYRSDIEGKILHTGYCHGEAHERLDPQRAVGGAATKILPELRAVCVWLVVVPQYGIHFCPSRYGNDDIACNEERAMGWVALECARE
jgi:hypothetical protein